MTPTRSSGGLSPSLARIEALARSSSDYPASGVHAAFLLEPDRLAAAAGILIEDGFFLECIAGVDVLEGIMVVYTFDRFDRCERILLRVLVSHHRKIVPSLVCLISGADWHERECHDFFGVVFEGHPGLTPLLLSEEEKGHPLLKENGRKSAFALLSWQALADSPGEV